MFIHLTAEKILHGVFRIRAVSCKMIDSSRKSRAHTLRIQEIPMHIPQPTDKIQRVTYAALALALFTAGVLLVLYGKDFPRLRGWFGDYLITIFLFFSVKVLVPRFSGMRLAICVFIFSATVELIQLSGIAARFNLTSVFWQLTLGSRFDIHDIAMYAAGCITAASTDTLLKTLFDRIDPPHAARN